MMQTLVARFPWPLGREMLRLMRVDRPIGTWLLLWPSLWALAAAADGWPSLDLLLIFSVGAFVMRSAGCVINDLADRNIDPHVARTRERPLAAGRIGVATAVGLLVSLLGLALGLALLLNPLALRLSVGGALLALTYPFTKRIVHLPQFYMGAAFGWGVVMGWAASTGEVAPEAWILFAATLVWAAGYDTIYAMMDREDDIRIGVKSTAILFARFDIPAVGLLYAITLGLIGWAGLRLGLGWPFYAAIGAAGVQMGWQLAVIRRYETPVLLRAFLSNQWTGLIIFAGILVG